MCIAPSSGTLFSRKTRGHSLEVRSFERDGRGVVGWVGMLGRVDRYWKYPPVHTTRFSFVVSFLACALDPLHWSYTGEWVRFSPILNQRSAKQWPVWINYYLYCHCQLYKLWSNKEIGYFFYLSFPWKKFRVHCWENVKVAPPSSAVEVDSKFPVDFGFSYTWLKPANQSF